MSGPAKFWLFMILLAIAAVIVLGGGAKKPAPAPDGPTVDRAVASAAPAGRREEPPIPASEELPPGPTRTFGSVAIDDAVSSIQGRGPAIAVFFSPYCPISKGTVPRLARLAREEASGVTFLGYAIDSEENPRELADFLARGDVGFETEILEEWAPGEFNGAIRRFGVEIRDPWTMPLVVVVGEDGQALSAWEGLRDVERLVRALRDAGWVASS
jgi:hypothetical protein